MIIDIGWFVKLKKRLEIKFSFYKKREKINVDYDWLYPVNSKSVKGETGGSVDYGFYMDKKGKPYRRV